MKKQHTTLPENALRSIMTKMRNELMYINSGHSIITESNAGNHIDSMSDAKVEKEYKKAKNIDNDIWYFQK